MVSSGSLSLLLLWLTWSDLKLFVIMNIHGLIWRLFLYLAFLLLLEAFLPLLYKFFSFLFNVSGFVDWKLAWYILYLLLIGLPTWYCFTYMIVVLGSKKYPHWFHTSIFMWLPDDPEVPYVQRHRNFLKEHVIFKEVRLLPGCPHLRVRAKEITQGVSLCSLLWRFLLVDYICIHFTFVGHTHQGYIGLVEDTPNIQNWLSQGLGPLQMQIFYLLCWARWSLCYLGLRC